MNDSSIVMLTLVAVIWIGWPLYRISDHLGALRKLAERNRR